jgi:hypothetical protein
MTPEPNEENPEITSETHHFDRCAEVGTFAVPITVPQELLHDMAPVPKKIHSALHEEPSQLPAASRLIGRSWYQSTVVAIQTRSREKRR